MSELLFETYNIPSVCYGVDSLFARYDAFDNPNQDCLIISSSTSNSYVMPVLDGRPQIRNTRRLAWGSANSTEYLLKLLQLKYPLFPTRMTSMQASVCRIAHSLGSRKRLLLLVFGLL